MIGRAVAVAREHAALLAVLAVGLVLRVLAAVAVWPGTWFPDSNGFITTAATGTLDPMRSSGYALLVAPFYALGSVGALISVQHLIGLAIPVALYALLLRRGASRWVALAAATPAALDAYLVSVEHAVMSDTLYHALLVGAIAVLLWKERLGPGATLAAGLLVGYAGVVRTVGVPFVAVFVAYLLLRRTGWRPVAAFLAGWALVTAGYATVYKLQHGRFALSEFGGHFLYARVGPFADCARLGPLPEAERRLCIDPDDPLTTNAILWNPRSPMWQLPPSQDHVPRSLAMKVIRDRPLEYARTVAGDFLHFFEPGHRRRPNDHTIAPWRFARDPAVPGRGYYGVIRPVSAPSTLELLPQPVVNRFADAPRTSPGVSQVLRAYQGWAFTTGPLLAACAVLTLVALLARRGPARLRLDAALLAAVPLVALLLGCALSQFSYRYGLIAPVLLPAAAALAFTALRAQPPR